MSVVSLHDIGMTYRVGNEEAAVLGEVRLEVPAGEFLSLMGPSGSGKSTLLNIIAGLQPPTAGRVRVDGEDLYAMSDRERTLLRRDRIGFVFQFFNLIPSLSVADNVALPLLIAEQDPREHREHIDRLLELVGLAHRRNHAPAQLSGGEMQRVTIARALVTRPGLLLADEPTGNVSARMGVEIMELLKRAHEELEQTILMVTHNHKDAARGDRVVFLKAGAIASEHALSGDEVDEAHIFSVLSELDI